VSHATAITAFRGPVPDVKALLRDVNAIAARHGGELQLLDARLVAGRDHLVSAVMHARRAFQEGRNGASTLPLETLRFASGERQIARALQKMGLREERDAEVAAIAFDGNAEAAFAELAARLGWQRDEAILHPRASVYAGFGVTPEEQAAVPPEKWPDLVLERVALVDLMK